MSMGSMIRAAPASGGATLGRDVVEPTRAEGRFRLSRRRFLQASGALVAAVAAACGRPQRTPAPVASGTASPQASPAPSPVGVSPSPGPTAGRTLYRDAALADARSGELRLGVSILVDEGRIAWIRPSDGEEDPGPAEGLAVVDASGATIVPGMVDGHSHLTGPGGAHWIDRFADPPEQLLAVAEENARLMRSAGVFWARDVGAPTRKDPVDGRTRALSLGLRDRWRGSRDHPYVRAAGTWVTRAGTLPARLTVEASDADELLALSLRQLDEGADFVKLYLDGPDPATSPWSAAEIRRVVQAAHGRGAKVTAHSGRLDGARAGAEAGVDSLEHGFELDAGVARTMAANEVALVSTLTVMRSWLTFARTTRLPRFASADGRRAVETRLERAEESVGHAHRAGVRICAGTDFGGGSARANQLAWEVESLVAAGLEPWEALAAATWRGGELLGEADAGVIRDGGPADFFLVHGDPLSDPAALWRVWRVA
jgi:imidazolonepropionase-like amidohydrolase